jgi:hyaluronan synthase
MGEINIIEIYIYIYILLSFSHLITQMWLASLHSISFNKRVTKKVNINKNKIGVIYPIYNESPEVLDLVLEKALEVENKLREIKFIFIDDGSKNLDTLESIYNKYNKLFKNAEFIYKSNTGKRRTQYDGFSKLKEYEYIITVDSDTLLNYKAIENALNRIESDQKIGAVTGDVQVYNKNKNLLTKLIQFRYWIAFHLERAAQSYTGSVLCCSGPFTIYRNSIIQDVKDDYINQVFKGNICTYGDDRHLTNLVISKGFKTVLQENSIVYTYVPDNLSAYFKQQDRWNKSFFREFIWSNKFYSKVSLYSLYDMWSQVILSVMFTLTLGILIYNYFQNGNITLLFSYITIIFIMALFRSLYAIFRTGNLSFILFSIYGFIHILFLMPIRLKALFTLNDTNWGTRDKNSKSNIFQWMFNYFGLILVIAFILSIFMGDDSLIIKPQSDSINYNDSLVETFLNWNIVIPYTYLTILIFSVHQLYDKFHSRPLYQNIIYTLFITLVCTLLYIKVFLGGIALPI